jgi:hypothetical protein
MLVPNHSKSVESRDEFHFSSGAVYTGEWKGQFRHGFGKQQWRDNAVYEGYWENNRVSI